jgi:creatinine amidohydrolase/Fe(II)-dependent formamide hydrolase-like protein
MKRLVPVLGLIVMFAAMLFAQDPPPAGAGRQGQGAAGGGRQGGRGPAQPPIDPPKEWLSPNHPKEMIEFDMMTWPEVYDAIHHQGKTVALFYTGGTEHRGPQNVNGGHTLMARETVKEIARRLGNAIVLPVLPYSSNNASAQQTGTLGLTDEIQGMICERIAEQAITNGFSTVILLNDHGGGVNVYRDIAKKLDDKYRAPELADRKIHVFYADRVYGPAQDDFNTKVLEPKSLPVSGHAGIPDTSEMMYLGKGKDWTRTDLLKYAVTMGPGYVPAPPAPRAQGAANAGAGGQGGGRAAPDPNAPRIVASGVSGDGRPSTEELGKMAFEMKVDYAVKQIQEYLASIK